MPVSPECSSLRFLSQREDQALRGVSLTSWASSRAGVGGAAVYLATMQTNLGVLYPTGLKAVAPR